MVFKIPVTINGTPYKKGDPVPAGATAEQIIAMRERGWIGEKGLTSDDVSRSDASSEGLTPKNTAKPKRATGTKGAQ